jgi:hypothetical protein
VAKCIWIEPARSDWCLSLFFSPFYPPFSAPRFSIDFSLILAHPRGSILGGRRRSRYPVQVPYSLKLEPYNPSCASTYSLLGSCLDPRPDLRRLRRAPGRGSLGLNFEACVCMCVSVWFVCLCACVLVGLCVCVFACLCVCVCVLVCLCVCVFMWLCVCVWVYVCVCL